MKFLLLIVLLCLISVSLAGKPNKVEEKCLIVEPRHDGSQFVPEASLFVRTAGKKKGEQPTIVLIHGTSGSNKYMRCVQDQLSKDFLTVSIDLRGQGLSEQTPPEQVRYTHEVFADDIHEVLKKLQISSNIVWVGVSLGGSIGLVYIDKYPGEVSHFMPLSAGPGLYRVPDCAKEVDCIEGSTCPICWENSIPVGGNPTTLFPETCQDELILAKEKVAQNQQRASAIVGSSIIPYSWTEDLRPLLASVKIPTLIGYGSFDPLQPGGGSSKFMHEEIDNSILVKFVGKGHLMTITDPSNVVALTHTLLNQNFLSDQLTVFDRGCDVCDEVKPTNMTSICSSRNCNQQL